MVLASSTFVPVALAQYQLENAYGAQDFDLLNGDSDIPVIVIPDDDDDDTIPPGGCRGSCPILPRSSSSSVSVSSAATTSSIGSSSSRAIRPRTPLRPAAPQASSNSSRSISSQEALRRVQNANRMKVHALERRKARLNKWKNSNSLIFTRGNCEEILASAWDWHGMNIPLLFSDGLIAIPLIVFWRHKRKKQKHAKKKPRKDEITMCCQMLFGKKQVHIYLADILGVLLIISMIVAALFGMSPAAHAEATTPAQRVFSSRLTNSSGTPITSQQTLRFSYWRGGNSVPADLNGDGTINTSASNYAGWQEEHTVTPNVTGGFTVELGKYSGGLPVHQMSVETLRNLYLQVEVKPAAALPSSFFLVDPFPLDNLRDRTFVSTNIFALNADMLDQRDVGTGSGSIPYLLSGGVLPVSTVPGGTNADFFTIDNNNTAPNNITLKFGGTLNKTLIYSQTNSRFEFNDDLHVQGNLTVSGTINGVDITSIAGAESALKASSGAGLNLNVSGGNYRINGTATDYAGGNTALANNATSYVFLGSGGLKAYTGNFPTDESFIPVAQVTTAGGAITAIDDKRIVSSDDREVTVKKAIQPGFSDATYQADASDNVGILESTFDTINSKNFYKWTSTRPTLQDYDVIIQVPLSQKFIRWKSGSLKIYYRTTSSSNANNRLDISVFDTNGTPVSLTGTATGLASTAWDSTTLDFSGSPTWTAGQSMIIKIKVSAKDSFQAHIGAVELLYDDLQSP